MSAALERLRERAFFAPDGRNRGALEAQVRSVVADLLDHVGQSTVGKLLPTDLITEPLGAILRREPRTFEALRASIGRLQEQSMNPYSPRYMGHMDSMPTVWSVLGDMLAAGLNNNLFALEMSPFLTPLERQLVQEFCALFGLPDGAGGLVLSGGSLANLQALTVARNRALGDRGGSVRGSERHVAFFCSERAHVSIDKAAMVLGLGPEALFKVPVDAAGRLDVAALRAAIASAREAGFAPAVVIATAGTTVTGTVDPLAQVADVARANDLWLHVDAIWGGGLMLSDQGRLALSGIERADSITFNPQKWMMVAKTCSLAMFRRERDLEEFFRVRKSYVKEQELFTDLSEVSLSGTKHAEVLKLWLSIESIGMEGYAAFVDHTLELARYVTECARRRPFLALAPGRDTALVCMRGEPSGVPREQFDAWNRGLQAYLLEERDTFFSLPKLEGSDWLRIVLLNPFLTPEGIDGVFADIDAYAASGS